MVKQYCSFLDFLEELSKLDDEELLNKIGDLAEGREDIRFEGKRSREIWESLVLMRSYYKTVFELQLYHFVIIYKIIRELEQRENSC